MINSINTSLSPVTVNAERPIQAKSRLLATLLTPFMDKAQLSSLALTTTYLNEAFTPSLWERVTFLPDVMISGERDYSNPEFAQALQKHGNQVLEICIPTTIAGKTIPPRITENLAIFLDLVKKHCPNVIRVVALYDALRAKLIADFMHSYKDKLLSVHLMPFDLSDGVWVSCLQAVGQLSELRKLKVEYLPMYMIFVLLQTIRVTSRSLKEIEFGIRSAMGFRCGLGFNFPVLVARREERPVEERQSRLGAFQAMVESKWERSGIPGVLHDCIEVFHNRAVPKPSDDATDVYFVPDTLTIPSRPSDSFEAADFFHYATGLISDHSLSRLELIDWHVDENVLSYISQAQQNLQSLYITHLQPNIRAEPLRQILVCCKKLESIDILSGHNVVNIGNEDDHPYSGVSNEADFSHALEASDLVGRVAWGCTGLKHWNVHLPQFCLDCRSKRAATVESTPTCLGEDIEKLAKFWQQLGKMNKLQMLGFGHCPCRKKSTTVDHSEQDHLSVQDEAGNLRQQLYETRVDFNTALSYLTGLSSLEELRLYNDMMHRTTIESLQVWKALWPKLRQIHGCCFHDEQEADQILQWARGNMKSVSLCDPCKALS